MQHYSPKTFLRQTSNQLLQACFTREGALVDLHWEEFNEHQIDPVYDAWQALPDGQRVAIERHFEDVHELANETGILAIIEEGQFHGLDLAKELEEFEGYRDKVMWVHLNYSRVFNVAGIIHRTHSLPQRYWRRRGNIPRQQPDVSEPAIKRFAQAISAYYRHTQGRGHHCTVDPYLRGNRYHYFFAYPDDYADTYLGHDDLGQFVRRAQRPAFEVVFLFDPVEGALDLYAKGGQEVQEELQTIFCRELLGQELPPEAPHGHPYELNGLKSSEFGFPTDPADGIQEVRVCRLRLSVLGGMKRRIILEADPDGDRNDVYQMIDAYLNQRNLPQSLVNITQATLTFVFTPRNNGRANMLKFDIGHPNSSNLKSKREEHRVVAEKYLRQWGIDRA